MEEDRAGQAIGVAGGELKTTAPWIQQQTHIMTFTTRSRNQVPIRLTDERWMHIVEEHSELAGMLESILDAVESADLIYEGAFGEKLATKSLEDGKYLVVVYREIDASDGFVITAFLTRRTNYLQKRRRLWP